MDYPKMIYLGGDIAAEWRIVDDAEQEGAAGKDGFFAHDRKPAKSQHADPVVDEAPQRKKPGPKPKAAQ